MKSGGRTFFGKINFRQNPTFFHFCHFCFHHLPSFLRSFAPGTMTRLWEIKFLKNLTKFHQNRTYFDMFWTDFSFFLDFRFFEIWPKSIIKKQGHHSIIKKLPGIICLNCLNPKSFFGIKTCLESPNLFLDPKTNCCIPELIMEVIKMIEFQTE